MKYPTKDSAWLLRAHCARGQYLALSYQIINQTIMVSSEAAAAEILPVPDPDMNHLFRSRNKYQVPI